MALPHFLCRPHIVILLLPTMFYVLSGVMVNCYRHCLLPALATFWCAFVAAAAKRPLPKVTNIELSTDEGFRIYEHWTTQAFTSLLSAFLQAKLNANQLGRVPDAFTECYFRAQTIPPMAKCIARLLRKEFVAGVGKQKKKIRKKTINRLEMYGKKSPNWVGQLRVDGSGGELKAGARLSLTSGKFASSRMSRLFKYGNRRRSGRMRAKREQAQQQWAVSEATERSRTSRPHYSLLESRRTSGLSPIGGLARLLMAGVLSGKNRTQATPWQESVAKMRKLQKVKDGLKREEQRWHDFIWRRTGSGRKRFPSNLETGVERQLAALVKQGIRIGMRLGGQNVTSAELDIGSIDQSGERRDQKLVDVLSPRFLSVAERDVNGGSNVFSPSLFSLHNKGTGLERALSLPSLMEGGQFSGRDQQEWMDLIMEASGVNEQVETVKELLSSDDAQRKGDFAGKVQSRYKREFDGLYLTKENIGDMFGRHEERKIGTWEWLERNMTRQQLAELNATGYTLFERDQLHFFYGPHSPYNDSEALRRLLPVVQNCSSANNLIESEIHRMAEMRSFSVRQNDIVLSPSLFRPAILNPQRTSQPVILSPIVFSPTILSPTIMGPAILSPRVFSPPILSPRIMTPLILSPFIFSSIILTPIIMQPFILSPGLLNGVILSPFVMNPMIMSSQVLHPFILSPLVMTPGILNPGALSPLVLSPFVMNPQVFSPKAISGLFLSPYALSPVFMSPVFAYLVVLSPSFLS